ncbi:hypothetical protein T01_12371 [Trichinella spiralis]|uniref:Uncharacterized protein n=1 Tax=Trichinella spiralis TaxID=6334 RepID=A0A0V1BQS4_TRISP|nr:hypothetical protein T01_12371 [Trichinella spiralis]
MPTAAVELWHTCRQAENVEKENGKRDKRKMILRNMNKQLNMMTLPTHKSREWQRGTEFHGAQSTNFIAYAKYKFAGYLGY